jgi:TonB family protein
MDGGAQVLNFGTSSRALARARAAAVALLLHVGIFYMLAQSSEPAPRPEPQAAASITVTIINQPRLQAVPPLLTTAVPLRLKLQVSLPKQAIDFKIETPAEKDAIADAALAAMPPGADNADDSARETPAEGSQQSAGAPAAAGRAASSASPGPQGPFNSAGNGLALIVTHYVEPVYPAGAAHAGEHGLVTLAVQVGESGHVDQIKVLATSGAWRLDEAAAHAVRQWRFTPVMNGTRPERVWTVERVEFGALPAGVLGVPFSGQWYDLTTDQQIAAAIRAEQGYPLRAPVAEEQLRSLVARLLAAFPEAPEGASSPGNQPAGSALEEVLAQRGPIQSIRFLGFGAHGLDQDGGSDPGFLNPHLGSRLGARAHWEIYQVRQRAGTALWLVAANGQGAIQRVEVAIRESE